MLQGLKWLLYDTKIANMVSVKVSAAFTFPNGTLAAKVMAQDNILSAPLTKEMLAQGAAALNACYVYAQNGCFTMGDYSRCFAEGVRLEMTLENFSNKAVELLEVNGTSCALALGALIGVPALLIGAHQLYKQRGAKPQETAQIAFRNRRVGMYSTV